MAPRTLFGELGGDLWRPIRDALLGERVDGDCESDAGGQEMDRKHARKRERPQHYGTHYNRRTRGGVDGARSESVL